MVIEKETAPHNEAQSHPLLWGYRKWTATFAPVIVAAIALIFNNPAEREAISQLIAGIVDMVAIGLAAWASTSYFKANLAAKQVQANQQAAAALQPPAPPPSAQTQPAPAPVWNAQAFDARVKEKAAATYGVQNPSTELFQALAEGQAAPAEHIEHVEAYWDYALMKAEARFSDIWGYSFSEATERVSEAGCPTCPTACGNFSSLKHKALALGERYYTAYLDYARVREKLFAVRELAARSAQGFDWKAKLPPSYLNLYYVGEMASYLLK